MKAILPVAGKGTRMRPLTYHTPKPLIRVAGKPVLRYILDDLQEIGVEEAVFVTGYLGDVLEAWIIEAYPGLECHFVVQEVQDGTAGAVKLAEPWADDELLIVFTDTLFDADLGLVRTLSDRWAGVLWAKEVEDYQRFGVIVPDDDGAMRRIVEKPDEPISRLANIGVYHIRDYPLLFEGINATLDAEPGPGGEFFLTDAFQYMVDRGALLKVAPVEGWYDCGKPETVLDTNRHLLETGRAGVLGELEESHLDGPVRVEEGARIQGSRLGPNVTVEQGARVRGSTLRDTVVGAEAVVEDCELRSSLLGERARVRGLEGTATLAADSVVDG